MTTQKSTSRRSLLRMLGASGLLAGVGASTTAASGKRQFDGPDSVQFEIFPVYGSDITVFPPLDLETGSDYTGVEEMFDRPNVVVAGSDPGVLFNASNIELTPNDRTLHYRFQFSPGALLVGDAKPYTLTRNSECTYTSRGQTITFEIGEQLAEIVGPLLEVLVPEGELEDFIGRFLHDPGTRESVLNEKSEELGLVIESLFVELGMDLPPEPVLEPLMPAVVHLFVLFAAHFEPGTWRAVGQDTISLGKGGDDDVWAVTRADFYNIGNGRATYRFSLLYLIWETGGDPSKPMVEGATFLKNGTANLGGNAAQGPGR